MVALMVVCSVSLQICMYQADTSLAKMASDLSPMLSSSTSVFGLKVWVLVAIVICLFIVVILGVLSLCLTFQKKSRRAKGSVPPSQTPKTSREIKEIKGQSCFSN
ncbi:hypothetical protein SAY86_010866 [Trapa natans]|uniref:Uncharacterized protein n=1 Tax=Trapa natans TaxID=22666 RepID=A0AAN7LFF2_TRANT|nr:hypothetical protein SAY86_010866 [Trapa natans]